MTQPAPWAYLFLINPLAGKRQSHRLPGLIRTAFGIAPSATESATVTTTATTTTDPSEAAVFIQETNHPGHASELAAAFAHQWGKRALIVACGGDGTAHEVANAIVGTDATMTILPVGSSNDFVRSAVSHLDTVSLLAQLPQVRVERIDLIRINDRYCLNIASFGFDTQVLRLMRKISGRFRFLGLFSYQLAIAIALFGNRRFSMRCQLGQAPERPVDYILAALCNGRYYGGGFNPAPTAQLDDGQLELVLIDPMPLGRILNLIPIYKKGRHLGDPAVHLTSVTSGSLSAEPGQLLLGNLDGELYETARLDFAVVPQAIRFGFY